MKKGISLLLLLPTWISSNTVAHTTHASYDIDYSELMKSVEISDETMILEECVNIYDMCNGQIDDKSELIEAMIWVESRGNDSSYHSGEKAIGCLQIRPIMVREVNRVGKLKGMIDTFEHRDAWDRKISIAMFDQWSSVHHSDDDFEAMARNWNGGPNGINKSATEGYWRKALDYAFKHL